MSSKYLFNNVLVEAKEVYCEANHIGHEPERETQWCPFIVEDAEAIRKRTGELD